MALELHRLLQTNGNAFSPPADVLVDDEGVTPLVRFLPPDDRASSRL